MENRKYEVYVKVLNEKPPQQIIDNFNYTLDEAINRILEDRDTQSGAETVP